MTLTQHLAFTSAAAAVLAPVWGIEASVLFGVGGVLIDVDHYLLFIQRRRSLSVSGMFRYFRELLPIQNSIPYIGLCIFHTLDFFLLLAVLCFFYPVLTPLLIGCLYHFFLDLCHLGRNKILLIRPYFLIEHFIRRQSTGYPWY